jgi:hypothetical protein
MTLGFSTKIKGRQVHFAEKIIRSLDISEPKKMTNYDLLAEIQKENEQLNIHEFQELKPKIHTIREDKKNRWKVGSAIHFVINNRTKKRFQFAPILKVKVIQRISIKYTVKGVATVYINNRFIDSYNCEELAINDGFDNAKDFFEWFSTDFEGKIIHWTNARY